MREGEDGEAGVVPILALSMVLIGVWCVSFYVFTATLMGSGISKKKSVPCRQVLRYKGGEHHHGVVPSLLFNPQR